MQVYLSLGCSRGWNHTLGKGEDVLLMRIYPSLVPWTSQISTHAHSHQQSKCKELPPLIPLISVLYGSGSQLWLPIRIIGEDFKNPYSQEAYKTNEIRISGPWDPTSFSTFKAPRWFQCAAKFENSIRSSFVHLILTPQVTQEPMPPASHAHPLCPKLLIT